MTKALEVIAEHRRAAGDGARPQGLFALANNGFPEAHQNNLALSILRRFAARSGMAWLGGMALGAGEGMIGGHPLEAKSTDGIPLFRVSQALDAAGAALARGEALPAEAWQGMARVPIPYMPRLIWHRTVHQGRGLLLAEARGRQRPLQSRHAGRPSRRAGPLGCSDPKM